MAENGGVTRRGLLQVLGIGALSTVLPRTASGDVLVPTERPDTATIDDDSWVQIGTRPTKLEQFLKSRGIKPAHLARESGYSRQHLLRLRMARMLPTKQCAFAITRACRRLARENVRARDLFDVWLPDVLLQPAEIG